MKNKIIGVDIDRDETGKIIDISFRFRDDPFTSWSYKGFQNFSETKKYLEKIYTTILEYEPKD